MFVFHLRFNSYEVRLKESSWQGASPRSLCFNSYEVRLKVYKAHGKELVITCFNSYEVRLKVTVEGYKKGGLGVFQFL